MRVGQAGVPAMGTAPIACPLTFAPVRVASGAARGGHDRSGCDAGERLAIPWRADGFAGALARTYLPPYRA